MKKPRISVGLCILLLALGSCQSSPNAPSGDTLEADGKKLADLQCQAKRLQNERYALADAIRFLEDSVKIAASEPARQADYQARLDSLNGMTDNMWRRTKAMADSITHVLERLHKTSYHSRENRKLLDDAMQTAYERDCKE